MRGVKAIANAVVRIYAEGGVFAFWTGNGLSVAKILPESAIKFLTYESSVSRSHPVQQTDSTGTVIRNVCLQDIGIKWTTPER